MLGMFRVKHTCDNVWDGEQETLQVSRNSGLSSFDRCDRFGERFMDLHAQTHGSSSTSCNCEQLLCVKQKPNEFSHIRYYILHVFIEISDKGTLHLVAVIISHKIEF